MHKSSNKLITRDCVKLKCTYVWNPIEKKASSEDSKACRNWNSAFYCMYSTIWKKITACGVSKKKSIPTNCSGVAMQNQKQFKFCDCIEWTEWVEKKKSKFNISTSHVRRFLLLKFRMTLKYIWNNIVSSYEPLYFWRHFCFILFVWFAFYITSNEMYFFFFILFLYCVWCVWVTFVLVSIGRINNLPANV